MTEAEKEQHYIAVSSTNLDRQSNMIVNALKAMNNIIFIVSTGAFALTISFIGYIKNYIYCSRLLLFSWVCLFLSITLNFIAHWITMASARRSMELINKWRTSGFPEPKNFNKSVEEDERMLKYKKFAKLDNFLVLIFLPLGILALIIFAWINFSAQNKINKLVTINMNVPSYDMLLL